MIILQQAQGVYAKMLQFFLQAFSLYMVCFVFFPIHIIIILIFDAERVILSWTHDPEPIVVMLHLDPPCLDPVGSNCQQS